MSHEPQLGVPGVPSKGRSIIVDLLPSSGSMQGPASRLPYTAAYTGTSRLCHSAVRRNPHAILGVRPGVCDSGLKAAYRAAALRHHPDRVQPAERDAAAQQFKAINEAYERLNGLRQHGRRRPADHHFLHPSLFWEVLGVHSNHFEGTLDHVMRAVAFRVWGSSRVSIRP